MALKLRKIEVKTAQGKSLALACNGLLAAMHGATVVVAIVSPLGSEAIDVVIVRPADAKERARYDEA